MDRLAVALIVLEYAGVVERLARSRELSAFRSSQGTALNVAGAGQQGQAVRIGEADKMNGGARFKSLRHRRQAVLFLVDDGIGGHDRQQIRLLLDATLCAAVDLPQLSLQDEQREAHRKRQLQNDEADRQLAADRSIPEPGHPYPFLRSRRWVTRVSRKRTRASQS